MLKKILRYILWIALVGVLLLGFQVWHEVSSLDKLVGSAFQEYKAPPAGASDMPVDSRIDINMLEEADHAFLHDKFDRAIELYRILQQRNGVNQIIRQTAEFHECLALYHVNGSDDPSFRQLLQSLASDKDHRFTSRAQDLKAQLEHPIIKWLN